MNHLVEAGPVNVAVLEEEVLLRECLCRVFESQGMHIVRAKSELVEFLARLSETEPDVAVCGVRTEQPEDLMPRLLQAAPGVAVVIIGARLGAAKIDAFLQTGVFAFVDRSTADPEDLVEAVQAAARKQAHPHTHAHRVALESVSPREREVLRHIAIGSDNLKIAAQLSISERTVKAHVSSLYRKLGCENRTQMAILARELAIWSGEAHQSPSFHAATFSQASVPPGR